MRNDEKGTAAMKKTKTQLYLNIEPDLHERLKAYARLTHRSMSEAASSLIDRGLSQLEATFVSTGGSIVDLAEGDRTKLMDHDDKLAVDPTRQRW